jgi:iron complex outermembrane recepter protein
MEKFYKRSIGLMLMIMLGVTISYAQTSISGTVTDASTKEALPGVNIIVKGTIAGTISNTKGDFKLTVNQSAPLTLVFTFIGYTTQEIEITGNTSDLDISMTTDVMALSEVLVSGKQGEPRFLSSTTIESINILAIKQTPAVDFFDALKNVPGVQSSEGSLNFTQINTRGFATVANVRFVQLVDGMDTSAPLLNFPTGNIVGMSELDAEGMELVPGAASALYGPNAFNGILIMKSKSPFEHQGLSVMFKGGVTRSDAQGTSHPLFNYGIRYAKAFNNKFAFKVNFSMLQATDWISNDYRTDRLNPESTVNLSGRPNFDGLNLYGDETPIPVPIGGTFGTLDLRRTGFKEEDILDNNDATSMKADVALHYKLSDQLELIYNYRFGGGSSIYQGTEKYALRDFTQQFHKLELKSDNFFIRTYMTETKDGDSWNMSAQGGFMNEYYSPTATKWAPEYAQRYVLAMQGYIPGVPAGNTELAHAAARAHADRDRPAVGTPAYNDLVNAVRGNLFQRTPPGSSFVDNSRLYHAEANYNFKQIEIFEFMIGGNFRQYDLFSDGTVFNENPEGNGNNERIKINEFGFYGQLAKTLGESLKLTASLRYDKNENFDGRVTPRVSAVYYANKDNNFRASFQTGFRNPDTQAQFIYFPSSGGTLLGSTEANAARYGVHNGGAWTQSSYAAFRASGGSLDPITGAPNGGNSNLLVTANIPYVKPEQLSSFEVGYRGIYGNNFELDLNAYYTQYKDFIGGEIVAVKVGTSHQGRPVPAGSLYSPYVNKTDDVQSYGVGARVNYNLGKGYIVNGSYSYATFKTDQEGDFRSGFNTPENRFTAGIGNAKVTKNFGFNINYRWQEAFLWESSFGVWNVPEFGALDAQVSYRIPSIKTVAKLGGTNLIGGDYRTNFGAPFVGQQIYISLIFDEFFR